MDRCNDFVYCRDAKVPEVLECVGCTIVVRMHDSGFNGRARHRSLEFGPVSRARANVEKGHVHCKHLPRTRAMLPERRRKPIVPAHASWITIVREESACRVCSSTVGVGSIGSTKINSAVVVYVPATFPAG